MLEPAWSELGVESASLVLASEPAWSELGLGPTLAPMPEPAWSELGLEPALSVTPLAVTQLVAALVVALSVSSLAVVR